MPTIPMIKPKSLPKPKPKSRPYASLRSLDSETTGVDLYHGVKPFIVTTCDTEGNILFWEWDVNPYTREPLIPQEDVDDLQSLISPEESGLLVLQNPKFDVRVLGTIRKSLADNWRWQDTRDTLLAGHLLASNEPHDLTSMGIVYLGVNAERYELAVQKAVNEARSLCRKKSFIEQYGQWRIAKKDQEDMPSAKDKTWKYDMWLPRTVARILDYPRGTCEVVNLRRDKFDIRIDRTTKWGNPFVIGRDGDRKAVIEKYRQWIKSKPDLIKALPELDGKRLGCFCKPDHCHGDVLKEMLAAIAHPWWTVAHTYANSDSEITPLIFQEQLHRIKERGLEAIYNERLKVLPVAFKIEDRGVTVSENHISQLEQDFLEESTQQGAVCLNIAKSFDWACPDCVNGVALPKGKTKKAIRYAQEHPVCEACEGKGHRPYELLLPKAALNKSLGTFAFEVLQLQGAPKNKKKKTDNPSLDKYAIDHYLNVLPPKSKAYSFLRNLRDKRKRDTALSYMTNYRRFWLPLLTDAGDHVKGWHVLHPSINPTGTSTLRWSSSNPNEQNISKQGIDTPCRQCWGLGEDEADVECVACRGEGTIALNLRYCFGPAPGREWWSCDAKNIELRIPAYESGEQELINLFERPDEPPYYGSNHMLIFATLHPDKWFGEMGKVCDKCCKGKLIDESNIASHCKKKYADTWYQYTKNGNFAVQYGAVDRPDGAGTADKAYHLVGAQTRIKARFARQEALNQKWIRYARKYGYVETMPDKSVDPSRGYPLLCTRSKWGGIVETVPLNYHVQGTAMWWMSRAMVRVQAYLDQLNKGLPGGSGYYLVMQVHDELVFDFPKGKGDKPWETNLPVIRNIQRLMAQGGDDIGVPTPVSSEYHSVSWAEGLSV